jgi:transposase
VSRERLSAQQWARLESELRKGPLAHGFANNQRWTLGRMKTLTGKLFHVGYTVESTYRLMRRHGWSALRSRCGRRWNAMTRRSSCGRPRCGPI